MRSALCLALPFFCSSAPAQEAAPTSRSAWVLALDGKGGMPDDLKAEEWKVKVGGLEVPVKRVESPKVTGNLPQNWALVFEPILDPKFRLSAFQAAAQFILNLPEGDRVILVARTKEGLVPLTAGLSLDRTAWVKGLEKLPASLSSSFDGSSGVLAPALADLKEPVAQANPMTKEIFFASLKGYLGGLPAALQSSPYNQLDPKGVRPIDRLNFDSPPAVRARLQVIGMEMQSLEKLITALGKLPGPNHLVVFSRNDADDFTQPSVKAAMTQKFRRMTGDEGGPAESAELAFSKMSLAQDSIRKTSLAAGVTLYSVAGNALAFKGNLGTVAEATGGFAFIFDGQLAQRFGDGLLAFGSRYRLTWEETGVPPGLQDLTIKCTRPGMNLVFPYQR